MTRKLLIALGVPKLAQYPMGGGYWSFLLQYALGLRELGHDVLCLQHMRSSGDEAKDQETVSRFLQRMSAYGFAGRCAVLADNQDSEPVEASAVWGMDWSQLQTLIDRADMVWDLACKLRPQLVDKFRLRVLVDGDPGVTHLSLFNPELLSHYDCFLTVGLGINDARNAIPRHGVQWKTFPNIVYLPMWGIAPDPGPCAPFSSLTHWTWEQLKWNGALISASKRDAYLRCVGLPRQTGLPFELAAHFHPDDRTGDRELLMANGWRLRDPHEVAPTPEMFRAYVAQSRAEICCPKPVFAELRAGWISDRSAAYLASGRPVLMGDTGIGDHLPTGTGLLVFNDAEEAAAGARQIASDYSCHARAARDIAMEHLGSSRVLRSMLAYCGF